MSSLLVRFQVKIYYLGVKVRLQRSPRNICVLMVLLISTSVTTRNKISFFVQHLCERTSWMSWTATRVCCLWLTCIQTRLFGSRTEGQAPAPDGVAERSVTGNMAAARKAQHEQEPLADERWRRRKNASNAGDESRCEAAGWGSTRGHTHKSGTGTLLWHSSRNEKTCTRTK